MITDILTNLPAILISFTPGYIFLIKINKHYSEKYLNELDTVIRSVIYSFIIVNISKLQIYMINYFLIDSSHFNTILSNQTYFTIFVILNTYLLFFVYIQLIRIFNKFTPCIKNIFLINYIMFPFTGYERSPSVWLSKMKNIEDETVKIRLKDSNLIYFGRVEYYTRNSYSNEKEISISQYLSFYETISFGKQKLVLVDDYYYSDNTVLLNYENILSIEIINYYDNNK